MSTVFDIIESIKGSSLIKWLEEESKRRTEGILWMYRQAFRKTDNPLFAWKIYYEYRKAGQPIPDDILSYLDSVAEEICKIAENPPKAISKALGLYHNKKGQGRHTFKEYEEYHKEIGIALDVDKEIEKGEKEEIVFEEIGKKYKIKSKSKIRSIYLKVKEYWIII